MDPWVAARSSGQGLVEYALIFALIIIVVIFVLAILGNIEDLLAQIGASI